MFFSSFIHFLSAFVFVHLFLQGQENIIQETDAGFEVLSTDLNSKTIELSTIKLVRFDSHSEALNFSMTQPNYDWNKICESSEDLAQQLRFIFIQFLPNEDIYHRHKTAGSLKEKLFARASDPNRNIYPLKFILNDILGFRLIANTIGSVASIEKQILESPQLQAYSPRILTTDYQSKHSLQMIVPNHYLKVGTYIFPFFIEIQIMTRPFLSAFDEMHDKIYKIDRSTITWQHLLSPVSALCLYIAQIIGLDEFYTQNFLSLEDVIQHYDDYILNHPQPQLLNEALWGIPNDMQSTLKAQGLYYEYISQWVSKVPPELRPKVTKIFESCLYHRLSPPLESTLTVALSQSIVAPNGQAQYE